MGDPEPGAAGCDPVRVRLLSTDVWYLAREARLAALTDAPQAFLTMQPPESTWTEERWRRSFETAQWAVATVSNKLVGLARLSYDGAAHYLESVWTHPRHRRRGVASALVRSLVEEALKWELGDVFVWVIHPNPAAFRLYASLGFEPTHERQSIAGLDLVEERLRLTVAPR